MKPKTRSFLLSLPVLLPSRLFTLFTILSFILFVPDLLLFLGVVAVNEEEKKRKGGRRYLPHLLWLRRKIRCFGVDESKTKETRKKEGEKEMGMGKKGRKKEKEGGG